jgi:hyperosmotically inducible protein
MFIHSASMRVFAFSTFIAATALSSLAYGAGTGQYIDDATITLKVKAAIMKDTQMRATNVKVETDQGIVQLSGTVNSKDQEAEALRVASTIDGVKSVTDQLAVKGTQDQY